MSDPVQLAAVAETVNLIQLVGVIDLAQLVGVVDLAQLAGVIDPAQLVGVGGAIGALCRYWTYQRLEAERFPVSTLTVNVLGSFVLGLVVFSDAGESILLFIGIGFCGAYTTFSTFSVETVQLWEDGHRRTATVYALANIVVSVLALGIAWALLVWAPLR